jgi:hypothetical protein
MEMNAKMADAAAAAPMAQESFSDYHLYTLGERRRSTTARPSR